MGSQSLVEVPYGGGQASDPRQNVILNGPETTGDNRALVSGIGLSEGEIVQFINTQWRESDNRMKPMQAIQDRLWQLYRNQEDFREKEDWQSMLSIPKASAKVRMAAANLRKLLLSSDVWLQCEGWGQVESQLAPFIGKAINELLQSKAFRFSQPFIEILECALAVGIGIGKAQPEEAELYPISLSGERPDFPQRRVTLRIRPVDYRKFKYGKYSTADRFDWTIEDWEIPWALLEENPQISREALERIHKESFSTPTEEDKDPERFDLTQNTIARKSQVSNVGVREYYGDVVDVRSQKVMARDVHIMVLNRKYLGFAKPNSAWHKRPPYFAFSPRHIAFRFPGEGILEESRDIFRAVNKLANLEMDGLEYSMLKQFEVDLSLLENPEDISTGIEPGKMYRKRMGTNVAQAIREIQVSDSKAGGEVMQVFLDRAIQEGTGVSDIQQGIQPTGSPTATEDQLRLAGSNAGMLAMALDIEEQALSPMAEMVFWLALQYLDSTTSPSWSKLLGKPNDLDLWTAQQRRLIIGGNYEFKFVGLSEAIRRIEKSQKIMETLNLVGQNPTFVAMVDLPRLFSDLLKDIGTGDYVNPNAELIYQMTIMQQAQAQQQAVQQKLGMMQAQFQMRNEEAMKRDVFKHALDRDKTMFDTGLKVGTEKPEGETNGTGKE